MEAIELANELTKDFQRFESGDNESSLLMETYFAELPEELEIDYMVYAASDSLTEEPIVWESDYVSVVRRMMFKKFDNWIQYKVMNKDGE